MTKSTFFFTRIAALLVAIVLACSAFPAFAEDIEQVTTDCTEGIIPGDANGDGKVNVNDAVMIVRYAAKWEVDIDLDNADAVNDDAINVLDAILIIKYAAKWDVRLGHSDSTSVTLEATCTEDGVSAVTCELCGSTVEKTVPALGHLFERGKCVRCDETDADYGFFLVADYLANSDELAEYAYEGYYGVILAEDIDETSENGRVAIAMYGESDGVPVIALVDMVIDSTELLSVSVGISPDLISADGSSVYFSVEQMTETVMISASGLLSSAGEISELEGVKLDMTTTDYTESELTEADIDGVKTTLDDRLPELISLLGDRYAADTGDTSFSPAWLGCGESK